MPNKQTTRHLFTILLMLLLGTFTSAPLVRAQKPAAAKAASPSGPKEGIKVHGHWTIDIRNPGGNLVSRREFKNALTANGGAFLGRFLQRTHKSGEWAIELGSQNTPLSPCLQDLVGPAPCRIYEPTSQAHIAGTFWSFKSLTITSEGGPNINRTVLTGTATARRDGVIDSVATVLVADCPVDTQGVCDPNYLSHFRGADFTRTTLATPINVVTGQIIQVKVVISFS